MKVSMPKALAFSVAFDGVEELEATYRESLSSGGLRVETPAKIAPFTPVSLTLALAGGSEVTLPATVVAPLPGALALAFEGNPADLLAKLKETALAEATEATELPAEESAERDGSLWD